MVRLKYNLDEISSVLTEPGRYRARLAKVEQTISSAGNPMFTWHWKFTDKKAGKANGKEIRSFTSLLDTALSGLKDHLMAFGLKGKVNSDTTKLIGRYVTLVVSTTASEDKETGLTREFSSIAGVLPDKKKKRKLKDEDFEEDYDTDDGGYDDEEEDDDDDYEDDEEDDDEYEPEEEDEVEEEPPARSRVSKAAKKRKKKKKKRARDEEDLPF